MATIVDTVGTIVDSVQQVNSGTIVDRVGTTGNSEDNSRHNGTIVDTVGTIVDSGDTGKQWNNS